MFIKFNFVDVPARRTGDISTHTLEPGTIQINMEGESGMVVAAVSCPILRCTVVFGNPHS